jgi:CRISPR/Cas system-associated exonuclease Cas4 (RecB family)
MMPSLTDIQFSQGSLQDYEDCPRRFQLRYVRRLRWPALEAEPALENEHHLRQGAAFHRLIQQHLSGIAVEQLSRTVNDPDLRRWWRNYLEAGPSDLPGRRYPEMVLSAPLAGARLVAKYDLIAVEADERAVIVDWKTNRKRPRREWLAERWQTRVYPYLLVRAGAQLNDGTPFQPGQVTMRYWFANAPASPIQFDYNVARYEADERRLSARLKTIGEAVASLKGDELLPRADDEHRCRYCRYRSLCGRGVEAGPFEQREQEAAPEAGADVDIDVDIDFEQIAEVAF